MTLFISLAIQWEVENSKYAFWQKKVFSQPCKLLLMAFRNSFTSQRALGLRAESYIIYHKRSSCFKERLLGVGPPKRTRQEKFLCMANKLKATITIFKLNGKLHQRHKNEYTSILTYRSCSDSSWVTPDHNTEKVIKEERDSNILCLQEHVYMLQCLFI